MDVLDKDTHILSMETFLDITNLNSKGLKV